MIRKIAACLMVFVFVGPGFALILEDKPTLSEARAGHTTKLVKKQRTGSAMPKPPGRFFQHTTYAGPLGSMGALISKPSDPSVRGPAIIWLTGGFPVAEVGSSLWEPASMDNDQSARAFLGAGMVMMFPTLRGCHDNPGHQESFYGEVDDVLAALQHLKKLPHVDPGRIYLGGHSTGGTLALLVAEASGEFNGVISFGPIADPADYGKEILTFDPSVGKERRLRAPRHYLHGIASPTFVIEGQLSPGNADDLHLMRRRNKNKKVQFFPIEHATHFNVLAPLNAFIAPRLASLKAGAALNFTQAELQGAFDGAMRESREVSDLSTLARVRASGIDFAKPQTGQFYLISWDGPGLHATAKREWPAEWKAQPVRSAKTQGGDEYHILVLTRTLDLTDLNAVFQASAQVDLWSQESEASYDGWWVE